MPNAHLPFRSRARIAVLALAALRRRRFGAGACAGPGHRGAPCAASPVDRVIAVVNDEALTQYDVSEQKRVVLNQMKAQNVTPPATDVLDKQLLERLITERVLLQTAKDTGIRVDDTQVERTVARIAQDNKLSADDFRKAVEREGISYAKYREDIRNEIIIQRLREREVEGRVNVSDAEVDHFLATLDAQSGGDVEYRLAHILVLVPEQASPEQIDVRQRRAQDALRQVRAGTDFAQVAAGFSDAPDALQGGSLGWRAPARLPTVFADPVRRMKPGEVSDVLRSAADSTSSSCSRRAAAMRRPSSNRRERGTSWSRSTRSRPSPRERRRSSASRSGSTSARSSTTRRSSTRRTPAPPRAATSAGSRPATRCPISSRR